MTWTVEPVTDRARLDLGLTPQQLTLSWRVAFARTVTDWGFDVIEWDWPAR